VTYAGPLGDRRIKVFVLDKVGGTYAHGGVLGASGVAMVAGAVLTAGVTAGLQYARDNRNQWRAENGVKQNYFCSELVGLAYKSVGLPLGLFGQTPSLLSPGDLARSSLKKIADIA
jgi:hypothetical protein